MEYSVPEAIIKLKQGFGRLIRSKTDTGIVVLLDSRVTTKRYGKLFLDALPGLQASHRQTGATRATKIDGMQFVKQPVERKLVRSLGVPVTIEKLNLSPLSGSLEVLNVVVGTLATVRRVKASVVRRRAPAQRAGDQVGRDRGTDDHDRATGRRFDQPPEASVQVPTANTTTDDLPTAMRRRKWSLRGGEGPIARRRGSLPRRRRITSRPSARSRS
jgi:hypothetical protein